MKALFLPLLILLSASGTAVAFEFSGRLAVLNNIARQEAGESGIGDDEALNANQQSARLMLDSGALGREWSLHLKAARVQLHGLGRETSPVAAFRLRDLAGEWRHESNAGSSTTVGYELDRAFYKNRFDQMTLALGRQAIDWGSGRFWQPLNVFGAFAPTDLDTDYKPGIDAALLAWYPSPFSSLTGVAVPKPAAYPDAQASGAILYRGQLGERSELSLLGGHILGNRVVGGAFESAWGGMGWRVEGAYYRLKGTHERSLFWIAGLDYQFEGNTLLTAEWYHNGHGAYSAADLSRVQSDPWFGYGLQRQLGENLLGLSLERDITPLLHGGYTLLGAALKNDDGGLASSLLHQVTLVYSLSNEADLLFSLLTTTGKGLNSISEVQSEFGHLPTAATLRVRFYF